MSSASPLSFLIFGAGAIGTYVGGALVQSGQRAVFIEQPAVAEALRQRGLRLDVSIDKRRNATGTWVIPAASFEVVASPAEALEHGPFDVAVFAMKSFDTAAALEGLKPLADQFPPILCLQNGIDNEPAIEAVLGPGGVIAGTVTCSVGKNGPGDIVLEKARGIGVAAGHPLSERLVEALNKATLNAHLYPSAADMKWSKVLMNLPAGATSAICDLTAAEVYAYPGLFDLEMRLSREAQAVMTAEGADPCQPTRHAGQTPGARLQPAGLYRPAFTGQSRRRGPGRQDALLPYRPACRAQAERDRVAARGGGAPWGKGGRPHAGVQAADGNPAGDGARRDPHCRIFPPAGEVDRPG